MPTLSRFYGVTVRIRWNDHAPPHVHVDYQGYSATLAIDNLEFTGDLPRRARILVLEWATQHRAELEAAWRAAQQHHHVSTIEPLE